MIDHIIYKEGIRTDPEKIEAMLEAPFSTTKCGVRAFLKITGYYRQFIERYAIFAKPLTRFLKDDAPPPQATPDALEVLDKLKQALLLAPILRIPNWEKPFLVFYGCIERRSRCNFSTVGRRGIRPPHLLC